jgi:XTP/dITP diphosphohydrolase
MTRRLGSGSLVIATHNAGKLKEIGALLAPFGINCRSACPNRTRPAPPLSRTR